MTKLSIYLKKRGNNFNSFVTNQTRLCPWLWFFGKWKKRIIIQANKESFQYFNAHKLYFYLTNICPISEFSVVINGGPWHRLQFSQHITFLCWHLAARGDHWFSCTNSIFGFIDSTNKVLIKMSNKNFNSWSNVVARKSSNMKSCSFTRSSTSHFLLVFSWT